MVEPGSAVRIPGTVLDGDATYSLMVTTDTAEVQHYPLEGEGAFDLEFPLPEAPGRYRVTMGRYEKGRLPREPVLLHPVRRGGSAPTTAVVPEFGSDVELPPADLEGRLLELLNAEREHHGLPPLEAGGRIPIP